MNYREFPPHRMDIGQVLDVRDAVAGKMSALWSRGEARDFIDIDAVLQSARFTRDQIMELADGQEATPMNRPMLADQMRAAARWSATDYDRYGVAPEHRAQLIARFAEWAEQLDPQRPATHETVTPPTIDPRRDVPRTDPGRSRGLGW